jgi:hypothetical protein
VICIDFTRHNASAELPFCTYLAHSVCELSHLLSDRRTLYGARRGKLSGGMCLWISRCLLSWDQQQHVEAMAPEKLRMPSGTHRTVDYTAEEPFVKVEHAPTPSQPPSPILACMLENALA